MAVNNTTGLPSTSEYSLGSGIIRVSEIDAAGNAQAFRDIGNAPDFTITATVEELEHFSSRTGIRNLDKTLFLSSEFSYNFTVENITVQNMQLFTLGELTTVTNPAVAGITGVTLVSDGGIVLGTYALARAADGSRCYDLEKANVTVKTTNVSPVTLVEGTDYTVSEKEGMIFLLSTSAALATAITNVEGLTIDLAADAGALAAVVQIDALQATQTSYSITFISENPETGALTEYEILQTKLRPDGDHALISADEIKQVTFAGKAEANDSNKTMFIRPIVAA